MTPRLAAYLLVVSAAALLVAGCGGGGISAGSSDTNPGPPAANPGGPVKKATSPNAPAGSKVTSCGSGGGVTALRAIATDCGGARATMKRWQGSASCRGGEGEARASCSLGAYRCQATRADRGTVVSCARPDGGDVSFIVKRRS